MSADPCPGEFNIADPVSSPVSNDEVLVRFIPDENNIIDEGSCLRLAPAHFSMADLNGERDAIGQRSISTFRFDLIDKTELYTRAVERTGSTQPLIALAQVKIIREVVDLEFSHRDLCVFADISEKTAAFDVSPLHASIRKSAPAHATHQRRNKLILRTALSDAFCTLAHLLS